MDYRWYFRYHVLHRKPYSGLRMVGNPRYPIIPN